MIADVGPIMPIANGVAIAEFECSLLKSLRPGGNRNWTFLGFDGRQSRLTYGAGDEPDNPAALQQSNELSRWRNRNGTIHRGGDRRAGLWYPWS